VSTPGLVELSYIVDIDIAKAKLLSARYGGKPLRSVEEISYNSVDLAIVAVPTRLHLDVTTTLLGKGVRGVLIEKPIATDLAEAIKLVEHIEALGVWASVGHVERFNPAIWSLHRLVASNILGDVLTIVARRVGPFAPRAGDTDVVYDLGVHEVDNALALMRSIPESIRAYTLQSIVTDLNDYALIILGFHNGFASLEVNRITPFKQRMLYITGSYATAYLDYMSQELRIYTMVEESIVRTNREEPLYLEDLSFILSFVEDREPLVDIYQGFAAMLVCGVALDSARRGSDIALRDTEVYASYKDYIRKAVDGYERYNLVTLKCLGIAPCNRIDKATYTSKPP